MYIKTKTKCNIFVKNKRIILQKLKSKFLIFTMTIYMFELKKNNIQMKDKIIFLQNNSYLILLYSYLS